MFATAGASSSALVIRIKAFADENSSAIAEKFSMCGPAMMGLPK
jgi:hypothetical protein